MAKKTNIALKRGKGFFNLVGEAKVSDFTFKMDEVSNSGWQYSSINLGVNTGNGNVVYCDMMGGFSTVRENCIYVASKEDIRNSYTIDWEDRFDEAVLETIHNTKFLTVGIEKDANGKTFSKRFLSQYDAIEYIKEHLEDGMVVNVKGNLKYSVYNDNVQIKKEITSIFLSKAEPEQYKSTFVQSILIGNGCMGKLDKETATYPIGARVLDYTKMWGDKEVKTTIPFFMNYEIEVNKEKPNLTKKLIEKYFTIEKGVAEIVVEGKIIEGQQTVSVSIDDIPEDIKELIELGIYEEDEILNKMAVSGDRIRKFVIVKPYVQMEGEGDNKIPRVQFIKEKYQEEDLILDFMIGTDEDANGLVDVEEDSEDNDWLAELGE